MDGDAGIKVVDRVTLSRADAAAWVRRLRADYEPVAVARGLHLDGVWETRADAPNAVELVVVWTLPDVRSFWRARAGAADPAVAAWWQHTDALALSRSRRVLSPSDGGGR
jgi:hypothetical protein